MIITYDKSFSKTLLPIMESRINAVKHLLPDWCQTLTLFYESDSANDSTLTCEANYYYRNLTITAYPPFFDDMPWELNLIHELVHALHAPYVNKVQIILEEFVSTELSKYLLSDLENEEEAITQDVAQKLFSMMK